MIPMGSEFSIDPVHEYWIVNVTILWYDMLCVFLHWLIPDSFLFAIYSFSRNMSMLNRQLKKLSKFVAVFTHSNARSQTRCQLFGTMIDRLMLHSLLIYETDPAQYPVSIAHKTYVIPRKQIFYSIMIKMITQYTILLYIYIYTRYDIVYSYTVYTIYIYISY